jgi:hypothetical protein
MLPDETYAPVIEAAKAFQLALREATENGVLDDLQNELADSEDLNIMCDVLDEIVRLDTVEYMPHDIVSMAQALNSFDPDMYLANIKVANASSFEGIHRINDISVYGVMLCDRNGDGHKNPPFMTYEQLYRNARWCVSGAPVARRVDD